MSTLTVKNITSPAEDVYLGDAYVTIAAGATVELTSRNHMDLPNMPSFQKAVADGKITVSVNYTADELASGLASPPNAVEAGDLAPVASTAIASPEVVFRKLIPAGGGGSPDDVTIFALDALPFKCRVIDAWMYVSGAVAASTVQVRTAAAGGGTLLTQVGAATTGRQGPSSSVTASAVATPSSSVGLFARRSDSAIAGELYVKVRRES